MSRICDILITDLRDLIADLGHNGGLISPSVYDTAQVIRLAPPVEGVWPALEWLLAQQQSDGGWGNAAIPRTRDLPTLAAVLALHPHATRKSMREAVDAGIAFLRRQAGQWSGDLPDDLPVGVELLLPRLLDEAAAAGIDLPSLPYRPLIELGARRRTLIARMSLRPGTTPAHSWEAFGRDPDPALLDGSGGIGHSPTATAAWLRAAVTLPSLAAAVGTAQSYLERAAAATGTGIPGVYPTVWPINRFEQAFALYALVSIGLLNHPALHEPLRAQIIDLGTAIGSRGLGMSDHFLPDGDDTAVAIALLSSIGEPVQAEVLRNFEYRDHFCAYAGELQPSLSVTAHAIHALSLCNQAAAPAERYIAQHRMADCRWPGDKWNGSWLYTTSQVVIALQASQHHEMLGCATDALLSFQHHDGGWGVHHSNSEETAYAVAQLLDSERVGAISSRATDAIERAKGFLYRNYTPLAPQGPGIWLGKELYRPQRIARAFELGSTLALALREQP